MLKLLAMLTMFAVPLTDAPSVLEPANDWSVEHSDGRCLLSRRFGTGADQVVFGFGLYPITGADQIVLIEPTRETKSIKPTDARLVLNPGRDRETVYGVAVPREEGGRITKFGVPITLSDGFRGRERVVIRTDGRRYDLPLSDMGAAFAAAERCQNDLMRKWGLDPNLVTAAVTPAEPIGSPASWLSANDYPRDAQIREPTRKVVVRAEIDARGAVTNCAVVQSSGAQALDQVTCEVVVSNRVRFRPARNAAGEAVPSIWIQGFCWLRWPDSLCIP
ncbi:TonB family protein [Sphingomonas suaedae]|uniref:TonB family protein n=1 Tax=Sphingomonas suaedae TaxID=2599297 RepID=A0A518RG19_9SPHN|nr:TonB family protein [Sphingomonas suaedae]QDX26402.1 TonB family protein [Sphingomonas suaedae]